MPLHIVSCLLAWPSRRGCAQHLIGFYGVHTATWQSRVIPAVNGVKAQKGDTKKRSMAHALELGFAPATHDVADAIEAHHSTPIEQLQPDSVTQVQDLIMLCATCHRFVHSQRPCLTVDQVQALIAAAAA